MFILEYELKQNHISERINFEVSYNVIWFFYKKENSEQSNLVFHKKINLYCKKCGVVLLITTYKTTATMSDILYIKTISKTS